MPTIEIQEIYIPEIYIPEPYSPDIPVITQYLNIDTPIKVVLISIEI